MKKGNLIVISGPSGVGKSTIREKFINENNNYWYSISMTTRKPRALEKNGIDYYFVTENEFKKNIDNNNFLEYIEVYKGLYYGTLKNIVFDKLNSGINVVLELDVDGALIVKKNYKEAILIFIKPPTIKELKKRLLKRHSESKDIIEERIKKAKYEIEKSKYYDYIVISGSKEKDYQSVLNIINNVK